MKPVLGVFKGEGVGPEVTSVALDVLEQMGLPLEVQFGGPIGNEADQGDGRTLSPQAETFCQAVFARRGAVLAGPGGGRFVYDCRKRFGLNYKLNPIKTLPGLSPVRSVDILVVRENLSGLYQCQETKPSPDVECRFSTNAESVAVAADVAAAEAARRTGRLTLVRKEHGTPETSRLWQRCAQKSAAERDVELEVLDVDYACYQLLRAPEQFDVILTSNCFGDILADLGGHLTGSRGMTFGASFGLSNEAIYQTNHGAAWGLAGKDVANPVGHLLSLAWMLERTYQNPSAAFDLRTALNSVYEEGFRTADLLEEGVWNLVRPVRSKLVGTKEFGEVLVSRLAQRKLRQTV